MQEQTIHTHTFPNGLTLLVEPMRSVQSAAFSFLVPAGCVYEPNGENGTVAVLSDWISRGAGDLDSRGLLSALDNLGVQGSESPGISFMTFSGATLAANLPKALELYADIILRPHLPDEEFLPAKAGVEQSLRANEDDPRQKIIPELRRRCYEHPWGRPSDGTLEEMPSVTADGVREFYKRHLRPNGAILGIAGNVEFEPIKNCIGELFGDWPTQSDPELNTRESGPAVDHITHESEQTHIALAYEAVSLPDPDYYTAWAAAAVLGQGMSSRLFTEVREKRGLCYSISASYGGLKHAGRVTCYAGTSSERAQETLDVTLSEIQRLADGVTQNELDRCKAMSKSSLVMQQESTRQRSWSIASNWHIRGRVVPLQEIKDAIDDLTIDSIRDYLDRHPAKGFTILTLGPKALTVPDSVSR